MNRAQRLILILALLLVVVGAVTDIVSDTVQGASRWHLYKECAVVLLALAAIVYLGLGLQREARKTAQLKEELAEARKPPRQPGPRLQAARRELRDVISDQFDEWRLTPGEREVGLLLLKGLSLREIAALRNTQEKTVRQQSSSIYHKADLPGRHAFSAWFIEDIL